MGNLCQISRVSFKDFLPPKISRTGSKGETWGKKNESKDKKGAIQAPYKQFQPNALSILGRFISAVTATIAIRTILNIDMT